MIARLLQRLFPRRGETTPRAISGRELSWSRGYSLLELERAGMSEAEAARLGLTVDRKRATALGSNVVQLEELRKSLGR